MLWWEERGREKRGNEAAGGRVKVISFVGGKRRTLATQYSTKLLRQGSIPIQKRSWEQKIFCMETQRT